MEAGMVQSQVVPTLFFWFQPTGKVLTPWRLDEADKLRQLTRLSDGWHTHERAMVHLGSAAQATGWSPYNATGPLRSVAVKREATGGILIFKSGSFFMPVIMELNSRTSWITASFCRWRPLATWKASLGLECLVTHAALAKLLRSCSNS